MNDIQNTRKDHRINRPVPSSNAALKRMQAAKPKNTAPEMAIRSLLHKNGLRYQVDSRPVKELNRRADIVFRTAKIAIFIDGCFWHGCPIHGTKAKENAEFWELKIRKNKARDIETNKILKDAGWKVVRIWEHENPKQASEEIISMLKLYQDKIRPNNYR